MKPCIARVNTLVDVYTEIEEEFWKRKVYATHLGTGLSDRTEVVDHVGLGHTDTGITDGENLVLLVGGNTNVELPLAVEGGGVGEGGVADFVEGIGTVGDQLTKEDLLVRVEGVLLQVSA